MRKNEAVRPAAFTRLRITGDLQEDGERLHDVVTPVGRDCVKDTVELCATRCSDVGMGSDPTPGQLQANEACVAVVTHATNPTTSFEQAG